MKLPVINDELAKRIEQSEVDFFTSRISSIGERSGNPEGVEIKRLGHVTAYYIRTMPWGIFNCVKGFSHEDINKLEEIIQFYRKRERVFQLDINPMGCTPQMLKYLAESGLQQVGFHSVLYGLPSRESPRLPTEISIREVDNEMDFEQYAEIHCIGSGMSITHKHHFVENNIGLLGRSGWKIYMAFLNHKPAAVAVMHISNNIASCTLAATVPEFRRNGLQTALLQRRMYEAHLANCDLVVAQASFGSTSQNNMERAGMQMAWTRAVWAPTAVPQ
ncbi:N-acetyltransferase [Cohnella abietis]|uniref:N-acetyltransferase n=1 Tax=Cohnella abietis TaxID=2507935 RepID=A0A3T1DER9_9BACL|nr:N-acetyltransferase [Cohnella abietis]BBI36468.1 N-acetyltransferase [Cohnella abietis]